MRQPSPRQINGKECKRVNRPALVRAALATSLALALAGCGSERIVVRTVTAPKAAESDSPSRSPALARARRAHPRPRSSGFVHCDPNIEARAETTTCRFAENTFYEYWASDQAGAIQVYSPAAGATYDTACRTTGEYVVCTTDDGGAVRFSRASVDRYSQDQADRYVQKSDLGPGSDSSSGPDEAPPSPPPDPSNDSSFCDTHDCIPNYGNGNGDTVQCADGTYSHSGGIQGACSHHGGVG